MHGPKPNGPMNLQQTLIEFERDGAGLRLPFYLYLQAMYHDTVQQTEAGLETVEHAFAAADRHDEVWWNAELYRLRGQLLERQGTDDVEVERVYQQAIDLAHEQAALALELRATVSLARLWQRQGRIAEAHAKLAAVYARFTEGFDTPDLQEARALLADLA